MTVNGISYGRGRYALDSGPASESARGAQQFTLPTMRAERAEATLVQAQPGGMPLRDYLERCVQTATEHLRSRLPEEQLAAVCEELQCELSCDPVLLELVRRATGHSARA